MRIRVGVIFGGESVEHEVSIISAIQAMNKMDTEKYEIIPIYITKDREWYTGEMLKDIETFQDMDLIKKYAKNVVLYHRRGEFVLKTKGFFSRVIKTIDLAFPIVHGTNVEDGVLQGYLHSIGIPYTGSNVYASVTGQDKIYMKEIFKGENLPLAKYKWFYDIDYKLNKEAVLENIKKLNYPVIIKPATLGSSVGIQVAKNTDELQDAIENAIIYDSRIVVEEIVENLKEVNISVLGNYEHQEVSVIEEVVPKKDFLTYEDKYIGNSKSKGSVKTPSKGMLQTARKIPADLSEELVEEIEDIAICAFRSLGSSGVCRIDFLIDSKKNKVYINEVNSIPGSLAFYLWEPKGKTYTELLDDIINIAIKDYKKRVGKVHSFDSNILQGFSSLKGNKGIKGYKG